MTKKERFYKTLIILRIKLQSLADFYDFSTQSKFWRKLWSRKLSPVIIWTSYPECSYAWVEKLEMGTWHRIVHHITQPTIPPSETAPPGNLVRHVMAASHVLTKDKVANWNKMVTELSEMSIQIYYNLLRPILSFWWL